MPPKFQEMLKEQRNNPETARAGLKWEEDEDKNLLEQVRADVSLEEIAKTLLRTPGSLKTRLITYALNKIENENEPLEDVASDLRLKSKDILEYQRKKNVREEKRLQRLFTRKQGGRAGGPSNTNSGITLEDIHSLLLDVKSEIEKLTN
jgi:hypothetical protein